MKTSLRITFYLALALLLFTASSLAKPAEESATSSGEPAGTTTDLQSTTDADSTGQTGSTTEAGSTAESSSTEGADSSTTSESPSTGEPGTTSEPGNGGNGALGNHPFSCVFFAAFGVLVIYA